MDTLVALPTEFQTLPNARKSLPSHPLLLSLADELVAAAPSIFEPHALALWWIFKYDQTNPSGIGIHADPAAVNINLWLTDDAACLDGGGLAIYSHVPALVDAVEAYKVEGLWLNFNQLGIDGAKALAAWLAAWRMGLACLSRFFGCVE